MMYYITNLKGYARIKRTHEVVFICNCQPTYEENKCYDFYLSSFQKLSIKNELRIKDYILDKSVKFTYIKHMTNYKYIKLMKYLLKDLEEL